MQRIQHRQQLGIQIKLALSALLYITILITPHKLDAQLYQTHFQKLETHRDESLSESFCLEEDPYGFLWIGTINGLYRYDGYSLRAFRLETGSGGSMPSNHVLQILALRDGNLLLFIRGGYLSAYARDQDRFITMTLDSLQTSYIYDMEEDQNGIVWITTDQGVFQFQGIDLERDRLKLTKAQFTSTASTLYAADNGRLWYATPEGIRYLWQDSIHIPSPERQFAGIRIDDIFESVDNQIYVLTEGTDRLWNYNENADMFIPLHLPNFSTTTPMFGVTSIDGSVWISELGFGLHHLDTRSEKQQFYSPENPLVVNFSDKYLRKPIRDYTGNLWFPGLSVYKIPATYKTIKNFSENFMNDRTVSAMYFEDHISWIGTLGGGLLKYDHQSNTTTHFDKAPGSLPDERVYCIKPLNPSHLVVTTRSNMNILNTTTGKITIYPVSSGPIRSACVMGDSVWVTHSGPGIYCIHPSTGKKTRFLAGENDRPFISQCVEIVSDSAQNLWLASITDGLIKFNPQDYSVEQFIHSAHDTFSISSNNVQKIVMGQDTWWIGTASGLNKFDPQTEKFTVIRMSDGLAHLVSNIVIDNQGEVWMTAGAAICHYSPHSGSIRNFSIGDGLLNNQFYPRAGARDQEGLICFGGSEGMDAINPTKMSINPIPPKIWINHIRTTDEMFVSNQAPENVTEIILHYKKVYCEIDFSATHFTDPLGNAYAYKIEEIHKDWISLGRDHKVTLIGLKPDDYTLMVKAANSDGVWSNPRRLAIRIPPPFWQMWWFRGLVLVVITGLIIWLVRIRLHMIRREEQVRAALREKVIESELRAFRAQMNPHFLFNSLNSIKSFIVANEPRLASDYLSKFAMLMRSILSHSKAEYIVLQEELDALSLYIELEQLRFDDRFTGEIEIDPAIDPASIEIQPLILQPFVENAIWHGLMHKDGKGHLSIRVDTRDEMLFIEIEDDGVGRSRAAQEKSKSAESNKSYGMQITRDRIKMRSNGHSAIDVIDLTDVYGTPTGTRVKIQIPFKKKS